MSPELFFGKPCMSAGDRGRSLPKRGESKFVKVGPKESESSDAGRDTFESSDAGRKILEHENLLGKY